MLYNILVFTDFRTQADNIFCLLLFCELQGNKEEGGRLTMGIYHIIITINDSTPNKNKLICQTYR